MSKLTRVKTKVKTQKEDFKPISDFGKGRDGMGMPIPKDDVKPISDFGKGRDGMGMPIPKQ